MLRDRVDALQGRLLFGRPTRLRALAPGPHAGRYRVDRHALARPDGVVLEGWSASPVAGRTDGVVLYFGGRNEDVAWAPDMASFLARHAVYAFNYRGFGDSTGSPSERTATRDARAVHAFVAARESLANFAIVGRSLGSALALDLAREAAPTRLVLLSPFEGVPQVLRTHRWGRALAPWVGQRFDCIAPARACASAALVLLAERDPTIPHAQSRLLCDRLSGLRRIEVVPGTTHQSLPRSAGAQCAIARFLAASDGAPAARQ